jgi:hypothetical protein
MPRRGMLRDLLASLAYIAILLGVVWFFLSL